MAHRDHEVRAGEDVQLAELDRLALVDVAGRAQDAERACRRSARASAAGAHGPRPRQRARGDRTHARARQTPSHQGDTGRSTRSRRRFDRRSSAPPACQAPLSACPRDRSRDLRSSGPPEASVVHPHHSARARKPAAVRMISGSRPDPSGLRTHKPTPLAPWMATRSRRCRGRTAPLSKTGRRGAGPAYASQRRLRTGPRRKRSYVPPSRKLLLEAMAPTRRPACSGRLWVVVGRP